MSDMLERVIDKGWFYLIGTEGKVVPDQGDE